MLMQRWKVRSSWRVVPTRTAIAGCISGCRAGVALRSCLPACLAGSAGAHPPSRASGGLYSELAVQDRPGAGQASSGLKHTPGQIVGSHLPAAARDY